MARQPRQGHALGGGGPGGVGAAHLPAPGVRGGVPADVKVDSHIKGYTIACEASMFNPVYDPYVVMRECDGWTAEQKDTVWGQIVSDLNNYDKPEIWLHDVACRLFSEGGTKFDDPRIKTAILYMGKLRAQYAGSE